MRALVTALLLHTTSSILLLPNPMFRFTDDIDIYTDVTVETLSVWLTKKSPGHISWGFGYNSTNADVFTTIFSNNTLQTSTCVYNLTSQDPFCVSDGSWIQQGKNLRSDGSFDIYVTRDIRINNGVPIWTETNNIIYSYDLDPDPANLNLKKAFSGILLFNFTTNSKVQNEASLFDSSNRGTLMNSSNILLAFTFAALTFCLLLI